MKAQAEDRERIVRWVAVPGNLKPMPIVTSEFPDGIRPDWVAVTQNTSLFEGRTHPETGFSVYFLSDDGTILAYLPFDTLEIALDQVYGIAGLPQEGWHECDIELDDEIEGIPWSVVARGTA
jgi:hypothetical protein